MVKNSALDLLEELELHKKLLGEYKMLTIPWKIIVYKNLSSNLSKYLFIILSDLYDVHSWCA